MVGCITHDAYNLTEFANALQCEFGSEKDEAEIHFVMANATRRPKETVKEYCFRISSLGIRYKLSEAAVIRYARSGLKHRELQQSIAAMKFTTMKHMRDAIEDYFVNRGELSDPQTNQSAKRNEAKSKFGETESRNETKPQLKCYNCNEPDTFQTNVHYRKNGIAVQRATKYIPTEEIVIKLPQLRDDLEQRITMDVSTK